MRARLIAGGSWGFLTLMTIFPCSGGADDGVLDETERWVSSFAITSGIIAQKGDATAANYAVDSSGTPTEYQSLNWESVSGVDAVGASMRCWNGTFPLPPPGPGPSQPDPALPPDQTCPGITSSQYVFDPEGDGPAAGSRVLLAPLVGANLELMTPGVTQLWGRPRAFVQLGVEASFGFDYEVANEGDAGDMGPETKERIQDLGTVTGRGSSTSAQIASPLYFAGAGVAFTAEVLGRRLRIKPSFEWMSQEIELRGETNFAAQRNGGVYATDAQYHMVYMNADKTMKLNGIGPGLELEIDTVRLGPFMLSVGIFGRAYHYLGNLNVSFSASGVVGPLSAPLPWEDTTGTVPPRQPPFAVDQVTPTCIGLIQGNNAGIIALQTPNATTGVPGCRTINFQAYPASTPGLSSGSPPRLPDGTTGTAGNQLVEATYDYKHKPWGFRGGVALRFRYLPD